MSEQRLRAHWWLWSAGLIAGLMVTVAVGNLVEADGGPLYGKLLLAVALFGGAALVYAGMQRRRSSPEAGSRLIGVGVLPGSLGIAFFWFPPAVLVGVLAIVTAFRAWREAARVGTDKMDPQRVTQSDMIPERRLR